MPNRTPPDIDNVLRPETPADFAALFDILEYELAAEIAGDREALIRPLALLGVRHLAGHTGLRCLLHGESGSGKTWAAKSLARHLGAPFVRISMPDTAETTWRGVDITNHIDAMRRGLLRPGINSGAATALANRAVVLIDDMDVMRLEPFQSYGDSDKGQRAGRQSRRPFMSRQRRLTDIPNRSPCASTELHALLVEAQRERPRWPTKS